VSKKLEIIPLGGVGEFGMNCLCVRCGDEMIVIDAGLGFPEESAYGVDVCVPDFDFLEAYRDDITAVILTHGHEDHLGGLPYLLKKFNVPVYASNFTVGLAESKLEEHKILGDVLLHRVEPREVVELGAFEIEFIRVSHSLVDCFALAIRTPVGIIFHTGDYKVDETPVIGEPIDLRSFRRYGQEGVLALFSDSTNATVPGHTPSERAVIPGFQELFGESEGRIIIAAFASSIHRIQIVLDVAQQFGRKVCVLGRSMIKNVEIAEGLGYLDVADNLLVSLNEARHLDDDEIVYLVTGSQGEARSVLSQMATQSYKNLQVKDGDTVVLSARIIPGNEHAISRLVGEIYKRGANIIDEKRRLVHVSGHASQEDIRIITEALRPKFVIPVHGEYRMLYRHREFVRKHLGYDEHSVVLIENGDVLELDRESARVVDKRDIGRIFIDETGFEEIDDEVIRERKRIAYEGIITAVITVSEEDGLLEFPPEIIARGVLGVENVDGATPQVGFVKDMQLVVAETIEGAPINERLDANLLRERVRLELKRFIQKEIGARPVIVPVIVQI
jgi:ribonuclease J